MSNSFTKVSPLNQAVKYVDPNSPSGLTQAGYRQFTDMRNALGIAPIVNSAPTQSAAPGSMVFNPATKTLYVYDGSAWRSTILT